MDFNKLATPQINFKARAIAYRTRYETPEGGLVVFNNFGDACGWINKLRDPNHWEPGCMAMDEFGMTWKAIGGNNYDGAESWEPINGA